MQVCDSPDVIAGEIQDPQVLVLYMYKCKSYPLHLPSEMQRHYLAIWNIYLFKVRDIFKLLSVEINLVHFRSHHPWKEGEVCQSSMLKPDTLETLGESVRIRKVPWQHDSVTNKTIARHSKSRTVAQLHRSDTAQFVLRFGQTAKSNGTTEQSEESVHVE